MNSTRRTLEEQITAIKIAIEDNPGITISGIVGLGRVNHYVAKTVLTTMLEKNLITKKKNRIFLNKKEFSDFEAPAGEQGPLDLVI